MYLVGYDVGSSYIHAALVEVATGKCVARASYPDTEMDMISRRSGWAEQQPEIWWQNVCFVTRKLINQSQVKAHDIGAVGISYQMHGLVLIDNEKRSMRPSIIWCDSRAVSIGEAAFEGLGKQYCLDHYMNSPGNFTASRLKWVKDHEPDIYASAYKFLLPGDYIAMQMTGEVSTTVGALSECVLWDFQRKRPAYEVLEHYGIDEKLLPKVCGPMDIMGYVNKEAAEFSGLPAGIPVSYRSGDQPTNALSLNVMEPGEVAATCGPSGVVYAVVDKPVYDQKSRINTFAHVNYGRQEDRMGVLLCVNGAGSQYAWLKHQVALSGRTYADMERMSASVPIGSDDLCILPFGNGAERILENTDPSSQIINLQFNRHTRAHLYRAALEGVAFAFLYGMEILESIGLQRNVFRVANDNMFQSRIFSKTLATLIDGEIEVVDTNGAVGAAQGAGVGAGFFTDLKEALRQVRPLSVVQPDYNRAQCEQAYHFWLSNLERALSYSGIGKKAKPASKYFIDHGADVYRYHSFLSSFRAELNNGKSTRAQLGEILDKFLENEDDWARLEKQTDSETHSVYLRIKQRYPKLSQEDVALCRYCMLGLPSKEIADLMHLSVRGVETKRYRLRQKFALEKDVSLEGFLLDTFMDKV